VLCSLLRFTPTPSFQPQSGLRGKSMSLEDRPPRIAHLRIRRDGWRSGATQVLVAMQELYPWRVRDPGPRGSSCHARLPSTLQPAGLTATERGGTSAFATTLGECNDSYDK
jgi:hypothetical protein